MTKEGWFSYTILEQMSNIGADVKHFIDARANYKNGTVPEDHSDFYYGKVMEYIDIIKEDPKNRGRIPELEDCKKEMKLLQAGILADDYVMHYWDQYTAACAFRPQRT
ncbi:MAG: hypothetical protein IK016_11825 [Lachnospiraceae bacterium]|nr:hypothetical protein [Lachnospiraceae bacterium]